MVEQDNKTNRRGGRSPAYPALNLKEALAKAEILFNAEQRHEAAYPTIVKHWGYSPKSGPGRLAFAALKKFGLIEGVGAGEGMARTAKVTESAARILLDKRPNSDERKRELQAAALRPEAHRKLWDQYKGSLPSDDNLIYQLRMAGFTEVGARGFVAEFRATLAFAEVDASAVITGEAEQDDDPDDVAEELGGMSAGAAESTRTPASVKVHIGTPQPKGPSPGMLILSGPHVRFPLTGNNVLEISLRSRVTRREFEKIQRLLELAEDSFVEPDPMP